MLIDNLKSIDSMKNKRRDDSKFAEQTVRLSVGGAVAQRRRESRTAFGDSMLLSSLDNARHSEKDELLQHVIKDWR